MKNITYDAVKIIGMPTDYSDTLLNFVKEYRHKVDDLQDINWVACKFLDEDTRNYYTWWCVNELKPLMKDKRSVEAVDTLKLYIDGKATIEELEVVADNASNAYGTYSASPYGVVAYAVAYAAAYSDVDVAYGAVDYVANAVAYSTAYGAFYGAVKAKYSNLQINKLIKILESK